jgi:hypothetical protein
MCSGIKQDYRMNPVFDTIMNNAETFQYDPATYRRILYGKVESFRDKVKII